MRKTALAVFNHNSALCILHSALFLPDKSKFEHNTEKADAVQKHYVSLILLKFNYCKCGTLKFRHGITDRTVFVGEVKLLHRWREIDA